MDDTACLSSSGLSSSDTPRRSVWKREEMSPEAEIVSTDAIFVWRRLRQCRMMWPAPSDVLKLCRRMICRGVSVAGEGLTKSQSLHFHIQTSAIKRKYPTLIVRIFLFQLAHIQYRDVFIFKHFAFASEMF